MLANTARLREENAKRQNAFDVDQGHTRQFAESPSSLWGLALSAYRAGAPGGDADTRSRAIKVCSMTVPDIRRNSTVLRESAIRRINASAR